MFMTCIDPFIAECVAARMKMRAIKTEAKCFSCKPHLLQEEGCLPCVVGVVQGATVTVVTKKELGKTQRFRSAGWPSFPLSPMTISNSP